MRASRAGGFSLVEVLVALAVSGLCMPVVLAIISNGLRAGARAEQYHVAARLADSILTELESMPNAARHDAAGTFGQYSWQVSTRVPDWWSPSASTPNPFEPYEITVQVSWSEPGRERSVSLSTLRLAARP
jgi:prepilin-type N-terminal cleavage/methylation domain-containing protein